MVNVTAEGENQDYRTSQAPVGIVQPVNPFTQAEWITSVAFNAVAMFCLIWTGVSFVVYGIRHGKWHKGVTNIAEINARSVYTATVASVCGALIRLVMNQVSFNIGYNSMSEPCESVIDASAVFYVLTNLCVFLVLWLKQFYLYRHIAAILVLDRWLSHVKWGTLLFVYSTAIVALINYILPRDISGSPRGCVTLFSKNTVHWPLYLAFCSQLFGQLLLIGLFVYPLRLQIQTSIAGSAMRILKRSAAVAAAMIFTDLLLAFAISFAIPKNATQHVKLTMFDLNMFLNLFCLVLSFESWRKIITCMLVWK